MINILLVSLFHAQDQNKYGFDVILEPLINDNKKLESQGVSLPFSDEPIYGTISQITGDNLGMHTILGFNESVSSLRFCRLFLKRMILKRYAVKMILRWFFVGKMCLTCVASLSSKIHSWTVYGLKINSTFNSLRYFHVCNNYLFDVMHDLLEGVAQYEIRLLFGYLR